MDMTDKIYCCNYEGRFITTKLRRAVNWLNKHREECIKKYYGFDDPDYCGMPVWISHALTTDEVRYLQEQTWTWFHPLESMAV